MSDLIQFDIAPIIPAEAAVLRHQGLPKDALPSEPIKQIMHTAYAEFEQRCNPVGLVGELPVTDFTALFKGEDQNHRDSPIYQIYPQARHLTTFVLTMGSDLSTRIPELFKQSNFALGAMLDSVASMAAEQTVAVLEEQIGQAYCLAGDAALAYSPGYCGWHLSGQKRLFKFLQPDAIGVTINNSYLMSPVKSVSGVVITGPARIHQFLPKFNFCKECRTKSCVERIADLQLG